MEYLVRVRWQICSFVFSSALVTMVASAQNSSGQPPPPNEPVVLYSADYPRIRVVPIVSGLSHPWGFAFRQNGDILVTERDEGILRVIRDGRLLERSIPGVPEVYQGVQRAGLMDIAIHPDDNDLAFLYGTILTDGRDAYSSDPTANACVFADAQVDRSPTGSGVTARIALQHRRGLIQLGRERIFESVVGSRFTGRAVSETRCGDFRAVTVEVAGVPHYTGESTFRLEDGDDLGRGFIVR